MLIEHSIVIIGGTSGIGRAIAELAADAGAMVFIGGSNPSKLQTAVESIPGRVRGELVDVEDEKSVRLFFEQAGEIDDVVSTVGAAYTPAPIQTTVRADHEKIFSVKYWGQLLIARLAAEHLSAHGSITLTSGILGQRPLENFATLASVNAAVEALVRTLALELAPIRVNAVSPGFIDSGRLFKDLPPEERAKKLQETKGDGLPARHVGQPKDAASSYLYAIQNPYVTGQTLLVDGGASIL